MATKTVSPADQLAEVLEKIQGYSKPNAKNARKLIEGLNEDDYKGLDDSVEALDEYDEAEREEDESASDFRDRKQELWDTFVESLEDVETAEAEEEEEEEEEEAPPAKTSAKTGKTSKKDEEEEEPKAKSSSKKETESAETIITFTEKGKMMTVFTESGKMQDYLAELGFEGEKVKGNKGALEFTLPKTSLRLSDKNGAGARKPRRTREMSDEERAETANRLWKARAEKLGLTVDELKSLHLRPGVRPTEEQMDAIMAARKKASSGKEKTSGRRNR